MHGPALRQWVPVCFCGPWGGLRTVALKVVALAVLWMRRPACAYAAEMHRHINCCTVSLWLLGQLIQPDLSSSLRLDTIPLPHPMHVPISNLLGPVLYPKPNPAQSRASCAKYLIATVPYPYGDVL